METTFVPSAMAFVLSLLLTPAARGFARRTGFVAQPKADRWHQKPTAMLGGVAIFLAVNIAVFASGGARHAPAIYAAAAMMFGLGLFDDLHPLTPYQKLVAQIVPSLVVVHFGYVLAWTHIEAVNIAFTMLWLIGIPNAINLLDNMDGLAAGITGIASFCLAINCVRNEQFAEAALLAILCGAVLGFLVFNFSPASVFMGDCGSMFIGFFLAAVALMGNVGGRSRAMLPVIAVPVLILFIPIFDTTFVAIMRKLSGRPAMQGGKDHTSHRLVALGLKERTAVLLLYGLAILAGGVGIAARDLAYDVSLALIAGFSIAIVIVGLYLASVRVYAPDEVASADKRPMTAFLVDLSYKKRVFEVVLDALLVILAYYCAYRIRFGPMDDGLDWQRFFSTLPVIIGVKITVFLLAGMYRGLWRYMSVDDLLLFVRAVVFSTVATVLVLLFTARFSGLSRVVFVIDGAILFLLVAATRGSFRLIRVGLRHVTGSRAARSNVLIFGAGDGGELLLRELENNADLLRRAVAFFDDDVRKTGKVIRSMRVYGGDTDELDAVCEREEIDEVIISTSVLAVGRLEQIATVCERRRIPLRRLRVQIVTISSPEGLRAGVSPLTDPPASHLPDVTPSPQPAPR